MNGSDDKKGRDKTRDGVMPEFAVGRLNMLKLRRYQGRTDKSPLASERESTTKRATRNVGHLHP